MGPIPCNIFDKPALFTRNQYLHIIVFLYDLILTKFAVWLFTNMWKCMNCGLLWIYILIMNWSASIHCLLWQCHTNEDHSPNIYSNMHCQHCQCNLLQITGDVWIMLKFQTNSMLIWSKQNLRRCKQTNLHCQWVLMRCQLLCGKVNSAINLYRNKPTPLPMYKFVEQKNNMMKKFL